MRLTRTTSVLCTLDEDDIMEAVADWVNRKHPEAEVFWQGVILMYDPTPYDGTIFASVSWSE